MNATDILKQVRSLLTFNVDPGDEQLEKPEGTEQIFNEAMLQDGTIVKWEGELAEGTALTVVTAEGEIPAPDGSHTLEDGTIITTEGGVITAVTAGNLPADAPENEVEVNMSAEVAARVEAIEKALAETADKLASIESKFAAVTEATGKLTEVVETVAAAPAAEPVQPVKFSKKDKQADKLQSLVKTFESLKNNN